MKAARTACLVALLVLVPALSCRSCREPRGPCVLLVTIDSLRADHVHGYGYARTTTPVLDGLMKEGTAWTGVVSAAPWTTPSMMSLMTGLYPEVHHVDEDDRVLTIGVKTLAQRFHDAGYATAAFVPEVTLTARFGFARGFDRFEERDFGHSTVASPAQTSSVIDFIQRTPGSFFVWVHLWDPHYNYNPSPPFDRAFLAGEPPPPGSIYNMIELKAAKSPLRPAQIDYVVGQFDGEIALTDKYLGDVLDVLREAHRLDSTLIVVAGDHGEAFQEHGWLTHTNTVYEETIHVPLIARWPGHVPADRRVGGPRSLVDLHESLAGWAGLSGGSTQSRSLPLETEGAPSPERATAKDSPTGAASPPGTRATDQAAGADDALVVSTTRRQATVLSARHGRWSLVLDYEACRAELYDLEADPGQTHDVAATRADVVADLEARVRSWIETGRREHPVPITKLQEADPDLFEKLRQLGYVGSDLFGDRQGKKTEIDPLVCLTRGSSTPAAH